MSRFNTTPNVLLNLLSKEGMSVEELKRLLNLKTMTPDDLLELFEEANALPGTGVVPSNGTCFVAGTKVLIPFGSQTIELLKVGDKVLACDPNTGIIESHIILQTFERNAPVLLDIYVDQEIITCTPEHPFWVAEQGWINAGKLQNGASLLTQNKQIVSVEAIKSREGKFKVYNLEVEGLHTYFVSDLGILVHNAEYDSWNITEHTITVKHHNWNKVFGSKAITLDDVKPIIQQAVDQGTWKSIKTLTGKGGKIIGEGLILEENVNGNTIWVEGFKDISGMIRVKNAGVK